MQAVISSTNTNYTNTSTVSTNVSNSNQVTAVRRGRKPHTTKGQSFPCTMCSVSYMCRSDMYTHLRKQHRVDVSKFLVGGVPCSHPDCVVKGSKYANMMHYRLHLHDAHQVPDILRNMQYSFTSLDEFKQWKTQQEATDCAFFLAAQSRKLLSGQGVVRYYYCNRSGKRVQNRPPGHKYVKKNGSRKCGNFCPAMILLTEEKDAYTATYHPTHYGHEKDARRLPLTVQDRESIASDLLCGMTVSEVIEKFRSSSTDDNQKLRVLTKKDVQNIRFAYKIESENKRTKPSPGTSTIKSLRKSRKKSQIKSCPNDSTNKMLADKFVQSQAQSTSNVIDQHETFLASQSITQYAAEDESNDGLNNDLNNDSYYEPIREELETEPLTKHQSVSKQTAHQWMNDRDNFIHSAVRWPGWYECITTDLGANHSVADQPSANPQNVSSVTQPSASSESNVKIRQPLAVCNYQNNQQCSIRSDRIKNADVITNSECSPKVVHKNTRISGLIKKLLHDISALVEGIDEEGSLSTTVMTMLGSVKRLLICKRRIQLPRPPPPVFTPVCISDGIYRLPSSSEIKENSKKKENLICEKTCKKLKTDKLNRDGNKSNVADHTYSLKMCADSLNIPVDSKFNATTTVSTVALTFKRNSTAKPNKDSRKSVEIRKAQSKIESSEACTPCLPLASQFDANSSTINTVDPSRRSLLQWTSATNTTSKSKVFVNSDTSISNLSKETGLQKKFFAPAKKVIVIGRANEKVCSESNDIIGKIPEQMVLTSNTNQVNSSAIVASQSEKISENFTSSSNSAVLNICSLANSSSSSAVSTTSLSCSSILPSSTVASHVSDSTGSPNSKTLLSVFNGTVPSMRLMKLIKHTNTTMPSISSSTANCSVDTITSATCANKIIPLRSIPKGNIITIPYSDIPTIANINLINSVGNTVVSSASIKPLLSTVAINSKTNIQ